MDSALLATKGKNEKVNVRVLTFLLFVYTFLQGCKYRHVSSTGYKIPDAAALKLS